MFLIAETVKPDSVVKPTDAQIHMADTLHGKLTEGGFPLAGVLGIFSVPVH